MKKRLQSDQIEAERRQLWREIAVAVAAAENTRNTDAPGRWADKALADFDKTFGNTTENQR